MNSPGTNGDSAAGEGSALELADIQGFILRAYRMPMVRHFLLTVGDPAQARRQLGRLVSGDESDVPQITTAEDWHVGFGPGPRDDPAAGPASQARLLPQRRRHVARTGGAGGGEARSNAVVQVIWCVRRRSRAASGVGRRDRTELARELGGRVWKGARSRPGDVARHQPRSDGGLQRQVVRLVFRGRCLSRDLAPGRDGVDGDARWPTGAYVQDSLRIHRRDHHAHHSRRPGAISPRSPAALRAMALRLARRR